MSSIIQDRQTYTITITQDDEGGFVGRCDELHANSQGETYGETVENMKEAVELAAKESQDMDDFDLLIVQER